MYTQVWFKSFFIVGTRHRTIAHTHLKVLKMSCLHSPKKRHPKRQAINLAPPERVRTWGEGKPTRFKDAGISHETQMLSLSRTCVQQPQLTATTPNYTQHDLHTSKHSRPKCALAQWPGVHNCSSTRMDLTLSNQQGLICYSTKKTDNLFLLPQTQRLNREIKAMELLMLQWVVLLQFSSHFYQKLAIMD